MIPYARRLKYAFRTFFSILDHSRVPDDVAAALMAAPAPPAPSPGVAAPAAAAVPAPAASPSADSQDRALQVLALLQRDGRLLDFAMEELGPYSDAQIGAAARDVHAGCRAVLARYFSIAPVLGGDEGSTVTVDRGTDPARVKVVGNVAAPPPLRGVLRHRGWEATRVELPPVPASARSVLAPAEVEVQ